jgi:hypothetical protein
MFWLDKPRSVSTGMVPYSPIPLRVTVCGLPAALVLTFNVALGASVVGVKVTLMVQLAPAARVLPQV